MSFKILSETEQVSMENRIFSYAFSYLQELETIMQQINEGKEELIKTSTHDNDGWIEVCFYIVDGQRKKTDEIKDRLISFAKEITEDNSLTNYQTLESDMEEFRQHVSCSLPGEWKMVYSPINDILIAKVTRKEKESVCLK